MSRGAALGAILAAACTGLVVDIVRSNIVNGRIRGRIRPRTAGRRSGWTELAARLASWRPGSRRRARSSSLDAIAPLLDDVARRARSGGSMAQAFVSSVMVRPELAPWFGPSVGEIERGATMTDALDRARPELPPEAALAVRALAVAATAPTAAADTCERAARAVRDRRAVEAERAAQSVQARLSARVMTVLPLTVAGWSLVADHRIRHVLVATPLGWLCLAGGLALNLTGRWWSARLIAGGDR